MAAQLFVRRLLTCVVLLAALGFGSRAHADDFPYLPAKDPYTAEQKQWLTERAGHRLKVLKLTETDIAEAVKTAERMLRNDRLLFGKFHRETAEGIYFVSDMHYRNSDRLAYAQASEDLIEVVTKLLGEDHWRVRELRYLFNRNLTILSAPRKTSDLFHEMNAGMNKGWDLFNDGKLAEALESAGGGPLSRSSRFTMGPSG